MNHLNVLSPASIDPRGSTQLALAFLAATDSEHQIYFSLFPYVTCVFHSLSDVYLKSIVSLLHKPPTIRAGPIEAFVAVSGRSNDRPYAQTDQSRYSVLLRSNSRVCYWSTSYSDHVTTKTAHPKMNKKKTDETCGNQVRLYCPAYTGMNYILVLWTYLHLIHLSHLPHNIEQCKLVHSMIQMSAISSRPWH